MAAVLDQVAGGVLSGTDDPRNHVLGTLARTVHPLSRSADNEPRAGRREFAVRLIPGRPERSGHARLSPGSRLLRMTGLTGIAREAGCDRNRPDHRKPPLPREEPLHH